MEAAGEVCQRESVKEISTVVHTEQLRNIRYYVFFLISGVEFLEEIQLPSAKKINAKKDPESGDGGKTLRHAK